MKEEEKLLEEFILFLGELLEAKDENDLKQKVQKLGKEGIKKYYDAFVEYKKNKKLKLAHGAKLNYIKTLKNKCAEDEELIYFKRGGSLNCKCVKKAEEGIEFPNPIKKLKLKYLKYKYNEEREPVKDPKGKGSTSEVTYDPKTKKVRPATKDEIEKRRKNRADAYKGEGEGNYIQGPVNKKKCGSKIKKHQLGGETEYINNQNRANAKGLFNGMVSGDVAPTMSNIGRMISSAYKGWISPESNYITGIVPVGGKPQKGVAEILNKKARAAKTYKVYNMRNSLIKKAGIPLGLLLEGEEIVRGSNGTFYVKLPNGKVKSVTNYMKQRNLTKSEKDMVDDFLKVVTEYTPSKYVWEQPYYKHGGSLNRIPFYLAGTSKGGIKRFSLVRTGHKPIHFDSKKAAEDYRKKHKIVGRIIDRKEEEFKPKVLRADNTKSGSTAYGRQNEEAQYNNLSFKSAYNKARQQGKEVFGYKGKVYSTDLGSNAKVKNMTKLKKLYGDYLGFLNHPNLQNDKSRAGRVEQRKRLNVDNSYAVKAKKAEKEKSQKQLSALKIADNFTADKFVDAVMPVGAVMNTVGQGISAINGKDYEGHLYESGFNPFGWARAAVDGDVGGLLTRGVDAYLTLGAPGASSVVSKVVDKLGTRFAPTIANLSEKSAYIPMSGTDIIVDLSGNIVGRELNKMAQHSLTKWFGKPVLEGTKKYGRRSIEKAALNGTLDLLAINGGMNNAARYATDAVQNVNTGTAYFFRNPAGSTNLYDRTVEGLLGASRNIGNVAPVVNVPVQYVIAEEEE